MKRYFFHIRDGSNLVPDDEGMDCRNMKAVQDEAFASLCDITDAASRCGRRPAAIEIEDEDGNRIAPSLRWLN